MTTRIKRWSTLGLGAALATATLAGCSEGEGGEGVAAGEVGEAAVEQHQALGTMASSGEDGEAGEGGEASAAGEGGEGEGGEGEGGEGEGGEGEGGEGEGGPVMETLPVELRVAFMRGHVEAGLALYRAGAPEQAAAHLMHPVSETHAAERAGIDALGFDASLYEGVSAALANGLAAAEIAPMIEAAEANMRALQSKAGGDPAAIIRFLLDTLFEEYSIGVADGTVTDAGEYQDAYGFAVVARDLANRSELPDRTALVAELDTLIGLWPAAGPLAASTPAPVAQVAAQASRAALKLGISD